MCHLIYCFLIHTILLFFFLFCCGEKLLNTIYVYASKGEAAYDSLKEMHFAFIITRRKIMKRNSDGWMDACTEGCNVLMCATDEGFLTHSTTYRKLRQMRSPESLWFRYTRYLLSLFIYSCPLLFTRFL